LRAVTACTSAVRQVLCCANGHVCRATRHSESSLEPTRRCSSVDPSRKVQGPEAMAIRKWRARSRVALARPRSAAHSRPSSRQLLSVNRSWYSPVLSPSSRGGVHRSMALDHPIRLSRSGTPTSSDGGLNGAVHVTRPSRKYSTCSCTKLERPGWDSRSPCSLKRGDGSPVRLSHSTLCQPRLGTRGPSTPPTPPPGCLGSLRRPLSCSRLGLPPTDVTERLVYLAQRDLGFQG
jgi:hypothetical protein